MNYSWKQFAAFCVAAERLENDRNRKTFSLMLVAFRGDDEAIKGALKALE